jgi:hypothetical protein
VDAAAPGGKSANERRGKIHEMYHTEVSLFLLVFE